MHGDVVAFVNHWQCVCNNYSMRNTQKDKTTMCAGEVHAAATAAGKCEAKRIKYKVNREEEEENEMKRNTQHKLEK